VFVFLWAAPAFSQGCAMCRSSAEATSKDGRKAISKGVVILLVPPLGIMTVGVWMAFRYGKRRDIEQSQQLSICEGVLDEALQVSRLRLPRRGVRRLPAEDRPPSS